jgi:HEAT repeat protein
MNMEDIIKAAIKENWDYVDEKISKVCNDSDVQDRAIGLLESENSNLRDLGASILAKAEITPDKFLVIRRKLGFMLKDEHPYARYRAAFALAEHGAGNYKTETLKVLKEASQDNDVGEIARRYIERLIL